MPTFEVRNRKTRTLLGRLTVDDPAHVLGALSEQSGASIEEIAMSLGSSMEEVREALEIEEVEPTETERPTKRRGKPDASSLPPRRLYA